MRYNTKCSGLWHDLGLSYFRLSLVCITLRYYIYKHVTTDNVTTTGIGVFSSQMVENERGYF